VLKFKCKIPAPKG